VGLSVEGAQEKVQIFKAGKAKINGRVIPSFEQIMQSLR
jgi:hypothetical protein